MSEYTEKCKEGIRRINTLTNDYEAALRVRDHGLAAIIKGQLSAARAYLQGLTDAGDLLIDIDSDIHYTNAIAPDEAARIRHNIRESFDTRFDVEAAS